jgi:ectoine hydroxylase-related dioxygenase (phytanoyl-CoA dioxygenase family)
MSLLAPSSEISTALPLQEQLSSNGYVVIEKALTVQTVQELRQFLTQQLDAQSANKSVKSQHKQYRTLIGDFFLKCPQIFEQIYCNEKMLPVLRTLLGDNFVLMPGTSAMRDYFNTLHTDTTEQELMGCTFTRDSDYQFLMAGVYLQDNSEEKGGGMFLVPGSHRLPDPMIKIRRDKEAYEQNRFKKTVDKLFGYKLYNFERRLNEHPAGIDLRTKAGDIILFDARIVHRSSFAEQKDWVPDGSKLAIFSHFMRNNRHVENHINNLKANLKPEYDYLRQPRDIAPLAAICRQHGFETA